MEINVSVFKPRDILHAKENVVDAIEVLDEVLTAICVGFPNMRVDFSNSADGVVISIGAPSNYLEPGTIVKVPLRLGSEEESFAQLELRELASNWAGIFTFETERLFVRAERNQLASEIVNSIRQTISNRSKRLRELSASTQRLVTT
ncbi:MAG: hypothetical protein A2Z11_03375 [Candidatus Woykebacteria bacterium RBG_16_43_9]|uniref:Uncharacterized protein n=1 Tax=Candidatus Woykebacteria bacterium RBG_16_43_9 TaxID=1802596 RepID=A0A1G1WHC0_9BACT|nr:MAG: hypothetical protein A2Z11_03375 [Candidatus Woykebacteria bacterium RBG_16_43_9]